MTFRNGLLFIAGLAVLPAAAGTLVQLTQLSDPPGVIHQSDQIQSGDPNVTVTAPLISGDLRFTHWEVMTDPGGNPIAECVTLRCDDSTGRGLNPVQFIPVEDLTATAYYLDIEVDMDADGIPDQGLALA